MKNIKIRHKLLFSTFVIPVILVVFVGYVAYLSSTAALRQQSYDIIYQYQQSTTAEILRNMNRYELIAKTISGNSTIQTLLSPRPIATLRELEMVTTVLSPTLDSFLDAAESGINIQLIRFNDYNSEIIPANIENILAHPATTAFYVSGGRRQFHVINYRRVRDLQWFRNAMQELNTPGAGMWTQVGHDRDYGYISFLHVITDFSPARSEIIGLLRLTVTFNTIYNGSINGSGGFNLVFDGEQRLLSAEPHKVGFYEMNRYVLNSLLNSADTDLLLRDQGLMLIRSNAFGDSWYIISAFPIGIITENVNRIAIITVVALAVAAILLLLLTYVLSNSFSKRINAIAMQMQQFSSGKPNMKITGLGQDEIGFLNNVFNDMSEQISSLIYDNYISDIEKKDALLKALQAQINPHILYNSLSSVSRLAELGKTEEIINMVQALVKFYRMTLNKGQEIIAIKDEISQIMAYIEVFRIRKGDTFNVTFDVDDDVLEYQTIKVILQPFVENIFEHVIKLDGSIVNIIIAVRTQDDKIIFTVQDDGIGIPRDKLVNILNEDMSQGYGIINVNKRVKLQYGADYGVSITSKPGIGTGVSVIIPKRDMPAVQGT